MFNPKRLLARSGITGILSTLAFAIPANAAVKAQCVVDAEVKAGTTKNATPGGPPVKYVQVSGGKGTFTFSSISHVCVDLTPSKTGQNPSAGWVTASGTFAQSTQIVPGSPGVWQDAPCGMGKVMGKITAITMDNPKYNVLGGRKFAIEFAAPRVGFFYWHHANPAKPTTMPKLQSDDGDPKYPGKGNTAGPKSYRYAGEIQLSPSQTKNDLAKVGPTDKCAKGFHVTGTVLVDEA
jgi:hypothetical protein